MIRSPIFVISTHSYVMCTHLRVPAQRRERVIHISPMADTGSARTVHRSRDKLIRLYFHHGNFMYPARPDRKSRGRTVYAACRVNFIQASLRIRKLENWTCKAGREMVVSSGRMLWTLSQQQFNT